MTNSRESPSQQSGESATFPPSPPSLLTSPVKVVLHDGHEGGHLTEDQHTMARHLELGQHPVQHLKLARRTVQLTTVGAVNYSHTMPKIM